MRSRRPSQQTGAIARWALRCVLLAAGSSLASAQTAASLVRTGEVVLAGERHSFVLRYLPVSSFPALPVRVASELERRRCMIPQTYEAHRPENVVRASLERAGSDDWAALCSSDGTVTLLVFLASRAEPMPLATAEETGRLQSTGPNGILGFNWGIDPASPEQVRQAQAGVLPRPAPIDHDALAEAIVEHRTDYHYFSRGAWTLLDRP